MNRTILVAALAAIGCKDKAPPVPVVVKTEVREVWEPPPSTKKERVPGGGGENDVALSGTDKVASQWLRAAKSDDILKLVSVSQGLSDPGTGATLDDDATRVYYGKLLASSQDWVGEKPEKVSGDRVKSFLSRNKVDDDLKKVVSRANYFVAADGGDEPSVVFLTVKGENVVSAVEVQYKGKLP